MGKVKIINFNPSAINEEEIVWLVAVSGLYKEEHYKCEYKMEYQIWKIHIMARSLDRVAPLIAECRRALGLEWREPANVKAD